MTCPAALKSWTADEVAECLDLDLGKAQRRRLYGKLWSFVSEAEAAGTATPLGGDGSDGTVETPDGRLDPEDTDKAPHWWGRLDPHEQAAISKAVYAL
jgi:hypothetical protein